MNLLFKVQTAESTPLLRYSRIILVLQKLKLEPVEWMIGTDEDERFRAFSLVQHFLWSTMRKSYSRYTYVHLLDERSKAILHVLASSDRRCSYLSSPSSLRVTTCTHTPFSRSATSARA